MGRSKMQGTPWHYEYKKEEPKDNDYSSLTCIYLSSKNICNHKKSYYYNERCPQYMKNVCSLKEGKYEEPLALLYSMMYSKNSQSLLLKSNQKISRNQKHKIYLDCVILKKTKCPSCKSSNIKKKTTEFKKKGIVLHNFCCLSCNHEWTLTAYDKDADDYFNNL
ncbi:hypothetical protein SAMN02910447_00515 [Ruminococcus sp. YE71]|uniref:hypothetical protein n=1 Tax=unclassified Ruminococcus TaxID=2608920 RepID=UPI0008861D8A|nr:MULTISPECIES: hypothetical protein [unclassified Ruminococcus]SDA11990.1 hypothetical protein SAMN02910446_00514 [Ruminococcus sp. YE78]SFW16049.1 hypothetical protein SAMN02910447_00515 [Ruminococcus sp. YE71]